MESHLIKQAEAMSFVMGGNALFTVRLLNGKHYTYKVLQNSKQPEFFNVSYLYGPDNTSNYKQFGYIKIENGSPVFYRKSVHDHAEVFDIIFLDLSIGLQTPGVEIYHSGRCCRCGRILTVPESIVSGIGPECAFKMSIFKTLLNGK